MVFVCGSQDWDTWHHPGGEERYFLFNLLKLGGRGGQKHRENNGYSEDLFGGRPCMVPELCLRRILLWLKEGGHVANPEQLSCKAAELVLPLISDKCSKWSRNLVTAHQHHSLHAGINVELLRISEINRLGTLTE